jgi:proteasome lid subunit RPN8/RPN11
VIFVKDDPGGERRLFPCRNIQDEMHGKDPEHFPRESRTAYFMDPQDTLRIHRAQDDGERIAVIYHSHIDCDAYFSETDTRNALPGGAPAFPETIYVVVSVVEGRTQEARAYRWDAGSQEFAPVPLTVAEGRA